MQLGENFKLSSQVYNFNSTSLNPTFGALVILAQIQTHVFKKRFKLHLTVRKHLATGIRQMERRPIEFTAVEGQTAFAEKREPRFTGK